MDQLNHTSTRAAISHDHKVNLTAKIAAKKVGQKKKNAAGGFINKSWSHIVF